ncbi:PAS domain-containing sensor histidine kinase [Pedobacter gandavensis]|uniref:histidine kinase n=1 Tax=Pedobacter gandavensis TaxID=2679963 RepID=A0ABR6EYM7_9SPHI|nr:ATP-binding protein [Pedobacter gandavensis]MBB2150380.1 PAS domain-containing protein [Pedobacter gandavensis]
MLPDQAQKPSYHHYLEGGGEMGQLIRDYDWSKTAIGSPEQWSQSLLTTISIIISSRFPMFLWWGTELIQFYNDAYRKSLGDEGKHPNALGQRGEDCWPEIWETVHPKINQALNGGEASWGEDELLPIFRNNQLEEVYWTLSFSNVKDVPGQIGGVLVICSETTEKVLAGRKIEKALAELAKSESKIRDILDDAPVSIALFTGPDFIIESANKQTMREWDKGEEVIGLPLSVAFPELIGQPFFKLLDQVLASGEPYYGNEVRGLLKQKDKLEEFYANFVYQPMKDDHGKTKSVLMVANVITEQVVARKKVEQAEEMLRLSIESANVGTWRLDIETNAFFASPRMKEMFGYDPKEEVSLNDALDQVQEDYRQQVADAIIKSIETGKDFSVEHPIISRDHQNTRWLRALGRLYPLGVGHPAHFSGMILDITEQKQDEIRKNDFIGMVSHELKTPLTSLNGYLQLMMLKREAPNDHFIAACLNKANVQVKKMSNMINGFLNLSRLESGKIHLNMEYFDLSQLVKEMIEEYNPTLHQHTITLGPCEAVTIHADRDKIGSVVSNLLSNAVKYSPKGKQINVNCQVSPLAAQISIKDEGMGIKPQSLEKLFERFFRVETKHTENISGFGIGLYLCSEILEHHGGKIWVESEIGIGSTFHFSLPLSN